MPLKDIWLPGGSEHFHEVWRNREYEVFVRHLEPDDGRGGPLHLSIRRLDRESVYDWRHKQSIKNEIAGRTARRWSYFPDERRLVDGPPTRPTCGCYRVASRFRSASRAATRPTTPNDNNELRNLTIKRGLDPAVLANGKQRPFQPGVVDRPRVRRRNGWVA